MHNIDRTQLEATPGGYEAEFFEAEPSGEWGFQEAYGSPYQELPLTEFGLQEIAVPEGESGTLPGGLTEADELALAAELLEVTSDEELDQFLGRLFRRIGSGLRRIAGPAVRFLGGALRRVARVALPVAGRVVGGMFGGPAGAAVGGRLADAAGRIFGLELEGLSPEDREFEVARRFVRFASNAIARVAQAPPGADVRQAVRTALMAAARQYAPGLLSQDPAGLRVPPPPTGPAPALRRVYGDRTGRWVRRGNRIILLGV